MRSSIFFIAILVLILCTAIGSYTFAPNDCPKCHNGGVCDPSTEICQCNKYWKNDPSDDVKDCSLPTCGMGSYDDKTGECDCADTGFGFINCMGCESDQACAFIHEGISNSNDTWKCSKDVLPIKNKNFFCSVSQEQTRLIIGEQATFECQGLQNRKNVSKDVYSRCDFQSWATDLPQKPGFLQEIFDCSFDNCTYYYNEKEFIFECQTTNCNCMLDGWKWEGEKYYCADDMIREIITNMVHGAKVVCDRLKDDKGSPTFFVDTCTIYQDDLPPGFYFELAKCVGRECYQGEFDPPPPEPIPETNIVLPLIIGGATIAFISVCILISCIFSWIHTARVTNEWRLLKGKHFGAKIEIRNLNYYLKTGTFPFRKTTQVLYNINHTIYPGQVLAIMGPSGAGKTSLLDILAGRTKSGKVTGTVLLNERPYNSSFNRFAGYVSQEDNLMGTQTVLECLTFAADLKLPSCVSKEEKKKIVNDVMEKLKITHIAHRKIGSAFSRGISGGERRRVAIGCELVGKPHVLFLDEPTSGLDAHSAYTVIHELVMLARREGITIVFSIHQPRSNIYCEFNDLMLLSKGRIAYVGDASRDAIEAHFKHHHFKQNDNFADTLIDFVVDAEQQGITLDEYFGTDSNTFSYESIEPRKNIQFLSRKIDDESSPLLSPPHTHSRENFYRGNLIPYPTSFYSQLYTLSKRAFSNFIRNVFLMPAHFVSAVVLGLLLGFIYWQQSNNLQAVQNRLGCLFFMCSLLSFMAMSSLGLFIEERQIFVAERANGYYSSSAYFVSKVLFDIIPLRIIPAVLMGGIAYFMIGLRSGWDHFLYFLIILVLFNIASGAQCIAIGSIAPSVGAANIATIVVILSSSLFGGFLLSKLKIPKSIGWFQYLSLYNFAMEALSVNELFGFPIIVDPVSVGNIKFPTVRADGQFILAQFGLEKARFFIDITALGAYSVFFLVLSMLFLTFFIREKR